MRIASRLRKQLYAHSLQEHLILLRELSKWNPGCEKNDVKLKYGIGSMRRCFDISSRH